MDDVPPNKLEFFLHEPFESKAVGIVENNLGFRSTLVQALIGVGHGVTFETDNLHDARRLIANGNIEAALIDNEINSKPGEEGHEVKAGKELVKLLVETDPRIGIISISSFPILPQPNPDTTNGRGEIIVPDIQARDVRLDVNVIAQLVGRLSREGMNRFREVDDAYEAGVWLDYDSRRGERK